MSVILYTLRGIIPILSGVKKLRRYTRLHAEAIVMHSSKVSTLLAVKKYLTFMQPCLKISASALQYLINSSFILNKYPVLICVSYHFLKSDRAMFLIATMVIE